MYLLGALGIFFERVTPMQVLCLAINLASGILLPVPPASVVLTFQRLGKKKSWHTTILDLEANTHFLSHIPSQAHPLKVFFTGGYASETLKIRGLT